MIIAFPRSQVVLGNTLVRETALRQSHLDQNPQRENLSLVATTIEQVTHEALTLSGQERAQLAHTLLCSLDAVEDCTKVEAAWEEEIARRVERIQQGTAQGRPAEDVFRDLRARFQ